MHTLVCLDCSFTRRDTLVDEAENCRQMNGLTSRVNRNYWCFSSKIDEESPEFRSAEQMLIRLRPCSTGCLAFRPYSTSKSSDFHHFNGRQGAAFT